MDGFVLINKPVGLTSREVSSRLMKKYQTKKVGHIGTLDPFASGLLIVAVNKATKAIPFVKDDKKTYEATLKLGEKTDTLDLTGKVIASKEVKNHSESEIIEVLNSFLGESEQIPPMTSAIHVNGKRLYELAHKGIEIERKPRKITVHSISLDEYDSKNHLIKFTATVSKGTYVRTLAEDIASKLGEFGHLIALKRTKVEHFSLEDANEIDDEYNVKSVYSILSSFMKVVIKEEKEVIDIKNGKVKYLDFISKEKDILVVNEKLFPIAVYRLDETNHLKFERGLF